ncbi:MAG TPA: NACHT domain-containing protein [Mycobacteriales bacterium]|nr:NACHT domain-containing protein [Mycobacteriales bacterium]
MARQGFRSRRVVLVCAGLLILAASVVWVVLTLVHDGSSPAADVAGLVAAAVGLPPIAARLWRWGHRDAAVPSTVQVRTAADRLATMVFDQWTKEAIIRSFGDPNPIPVRWRLTDRKVMDHPRLIASGTLAITGQADRAAGLADLFRGLRRRRLVILGGAGTGKTTLAVQLVLDLADPRTRRPSDPVPVLLPVAGWDTRVHRRLPDWVAARLAEGYPPLRAGELGPDAAAALVSRRQILPVLDGLDELPEPIRPAVIKAINASLAEGDGLVLTCRTTEYGEAIATAGHVLRSAAVIEPDPLTPADAADYLEHCLPPHHGPAWHRILTGLRTGEPGPLADSLDIPLNVWLLREVYVENHRDPTGLLDLDRFPRPQAIQHHLLDQLIPTIHATRPPTDDRAEPFRPLHAWDPDDARRWLGYLAFLLTQHRTRNLAWWDLARHTSVPRAIANTIGLTAGFAEGLLVGVAVGLTVGFTGGLAAGLTAGLTFGLTAGLTEAYSGDCWGSSSRCVA